MVNVVVLVGNVTRDPETRTVGNDKVVSKFGLASTRKFGDREDTTFVDIECWGKTAENVSAYLTKGRQVAVEGRLKLDTWEDKESGQKRSRLLVVASEVRFLGKPKSDEATATATKNDVPDDDVPF